MTTFKPIVLPLVFVSLWSCTKHNTNPEAPCVWFPLLFNKNHLKKIPNNNQKQPTKTHKKPSTSVETKPLDYRNFTERRGDSREQEGLEHPHHICQGSRPGLHGAPSLQDRGSEMKRNALCLTSTVCQAKAPNRKCLPRRVLEQRAFHMDRVNFFRSLQ